MKMKENNISAEVLAAYLDGNATASESREVLAAMGDDAELRELMRIAQCVDDELNMNVHEVEILPMTALAATCGEENFCCLECEKFILTKHGVTFDGDELLATAVRNKWQKEKGTALFNIGRHLENSGFTVSRRYKCSLDDIAEALAAGSDVIAVVDGGELVGDREKEILEDMFFGQIPDHTVVVLACDLKQNSITIHDPDSPNPADTYRLGQFSDAWADSKNYLVIINRSNMSTYIPSPIDLSDVELTEDLVELREAIAENAHEIWARNRQAEGWTYGPERNDILKQTPDMVAYGDLPDSEKKYDREMAMQTIKLLKKLGYDLVKRENTELYTVLMERIRTSEQQYECRRCHKPIYKHQVFCDHCGLELNMDWGEK